jgi:transposase InsO family protein
VWYSDITYIPMAKGFLYLVVIMDWVSRAVLAWRVSKVTSVKLVEIRDCGSRRPDAVAPVEGCLQSVRLRAAIDGMADCAAGAAPLSSPAPDGAPLRGCGA